MAGAVSGPGRAKEFKEMRTQRASSILSSLLLLSACGTYEPLTHGLPDEIFVEPHSLTYSAIDVRVEAPSERDFAVEVDGRGAATKDGFKMMAASPIGCLGAGIYAGFCYGAAPFFPIIAAARAEDADIVQLELAAFDAQLAAYGLPRRLHSRITAFLDDQRVPVATAGAGNSVPGTVSLNFVIYSLGTHHSGYKNGTIALIFRYVLELKDADGQLIARRRDAARLNYSSDYLQPQMYRELDDYIERISKQYVTEMLLEWSPDVRLSAVYPSMIKKRSVIGFSHMEWTQVDTPTPILRWQPVNELIVGEGLASLEDVTYDVEVFGYVYDTSYRPAPRIVVASGRGLTSPNFTVDTELLPCQRYYWIPRAHFRHRGVVRTVSAADTFVLLTPGSDCGQHSWSLPYAPPYDD